MILGSFEDADNADCCKAVCSSGRWAAQLAAHTAGSSDIVAIPCDNFISSRSLPKGVITDHALAKATLGVEVQEEQQAGLDRVYYDIKRNYLATISVDGASLAALIESALRTPPGWIQVAHLSAGINLRSKAGCKITQLQVGPDTSTNVQSDRLYTIVTTAQMLDAPAFRQVFPNTTTLAVAGDPAQRSGRLLARIGDALIAGASPFNREGEGIFTTDDVSINPDCHHSCEPGFVTKSDGCQQCLPGTFSSSTGATACTLCLNGYVQPNFKATSCIACKPGSFSFEETPQGRLFECQTCAIGFFAEKNASSSCESCPARTSNLYVLRSMLGMIKAL